MSLAGHQLGRSHTALFHPPKKENLIFEADIQKLADKNCSADYWGEVLRDQYYALTFSSRKPTLNVGNMQVADLGPLRMGYIECDAFQVTREKSHVAGDSEEFIMIPLASRSAISLEQFGRTAKLNSGDIGFVSTSSPAQPNWKAGDICAKEEQCHTA